MRQMTALGRAIESDSFAVIDAEAGEHGFAPETWQVVRRVVHATADFEFIDLMRFSPDVVGRGIAALEGGVPVVADVKMILAGLNEERLAAHGSSTHCFISDADVIEAARDAGSTRAIESMRKAARLGLLEGAVVAVGNAPTALIEVVRLAREQGVRPALVIGVPVGFVSAAESKALLIEAGAELQVPYIACAGRKGGSTIAVAIVHALLLAGQERRA